MWGEGGEGRKEPQNRWGKEDVTNAKISLAAKGRCLGQGSTCGGGASAGGGSNRRGAEREREKLEGRGGSEIEGQPERDTERRGS